jgi:nucleoside-diphosphate-sugar epimerase
MRVFLTGASGFVGSYVLRDLLDAGVHEVAVLLRDPASAWRVSDVLDRCRVVQGSLDRVSELEGALVDFRADAFVHLAWDGVAGADRNAVSQWRNVPVALELVELASRTGARHWIGLGSQAEYGPCQSRIDEQTPTSPTTLYGVSKLATCQLTARLCEELKLRHSWLRLFSSYGPRDNPQWLIPYLVRTLLARQRPSLTPGEQLWDYIYVTDVASAITAVMQSEAAHGVFNLGSGTAVRLRSIVESIRDQIDPQLPLGFGEVAYRPDQVMHLEANVERLNRLAGWTPRVGIDEGIADTVAWFAKNAHDT